MRGGIYTRRLSSSRIKKARDASPGLYSAASRSRGLLTCRPSGSDRLAHDAEALANLVGVERVALHEAGDEVRYLCAARVHRLAGALHLRVDDVARGVLDAVEERLAVRVFGLAEVDGAQGTHAELGDHAARDLDGALDVVRRAGR